MSGLLIPSRATAGALARFAVQEARARWSMDDPQPRRLTLPDPPAPGRLVVGVARSFSRLAYVSGWELAAESPDGEWSLWSAEAGRQAFAVWAPVREAWLYELTGELSGYVLNG